jgi:protein involved in polysaccharide export with SLBB domain
MRPSGLRSAYRSPSGRGAGLCRTTVPIALVVSLGSLMLLSAIGATQSTWPRPPTQPSTTPGTQESTPETAPQPPTGYAGYQYYPGYPGYPTYPGYPGMPPGYPGTPSPYPGIVPPWGLPGEAPEEGEGVEEGQPEEEAPEEELPEEEEEVEKGEVELPIFGHTMFATAALEPLLASVAPPPPSYVLGPGDTVQLMVWGRGNEYVNTIQMIATDGSIQAVPVGRIPLAGKTITDCQASLLASFRKYFPECSVSLTIAELRSIEVTVGGDVARPGRVVLPGTATVFTALYRAGGPLETGSLRRIDVRRGKELVESVDLYDFLLQGDTAGDIALKTDDYVFVHVIGNLVAVRGEVRRQAWYEIGESATLAEVLDMSGGLRGSAYAKRVQLLRSEQGTERTALEADLVNEPEKWRGVEVQDGDEVVVLPVLEELRNAVTVEGEVRRPGEYALLEGATISDVLRRAEGLTPEASRSFGQVLRESAHGLREAIKVNVGAALEGDAEADIKLEPRDIVRIYPTRETEPSLVYIEGAVVKPYHYDWNPGMTVSDLVRLAGGLTNDAYGEAGVLVRKSPDVEDRFITVPIGRIMAGVSDEDVPLQARDRLIVSLREEKARPKVVEIGGAIAQPQEYPLGAGMRVSDLIRMAGGLLPEATGEATIIHGQTAGLAETEEIDVSPLKRGEPLDADPLLVEGDTLAVRGEGGFKTNAEVAGVIGQVASPDVFPVRLGQEGRLMRLSDLLEAAGGLLPAAYPEMATLYHSEEALAAREGRMELVKEALQESASAEETGDEEEEGVETTYSAVGRGVKVAQGGGARGVVQVLSGSAGEAHIIIPPRALSKIPVSDAMPVDLTRVLAEPGGPADLELQDGDILAVFERPDTVMVDGAVAAPGPHPFVEGATVGDYVWEAGETNRDADMRHAVVVSYNGRATKATRRTEVHAGDCIIVPTKYITQSVGQPSTVDRVLSHIVETVSAFLIFRKL